MKEQTQNIALRLVTLSAAIPIVWLCKELSSRPLGILLTLTFYATPKFAIAICPIRRYDFREAKCENGVSEMLECTEFGSPG